MRFVEFYNMTVTRLLSALLSTDHKTPDKRYIRLLIRDYSTLIKRLQHSYKEITALLSRDYSMLIKRLQHSFQQITAKHNKNARIFKFLPPMRPIHINFLPVLSNEKVLHPV